MINRSKMEMDRKEAYDTPEQENNRPSDCGGLIKQINDELKKRANNSLRSSDLTFTQMDMLIHLKHASSQQLSLKQLEQRLHVAQSTTAGIAVRLEWKGFVESSGDPSDKRVKMIRVTQQGLACLEEAERHRLQTEDAILADLTEEEQAQLLQLLQKVCSSLKKTDTRGRSL